MAIEKQSTNGLPLGKNRIPDGIVNSGDGVMRCG